MAFDATKATKIANLTSLVASTDPTPGFFVYDSPDNVATTTAAHYFDGYASELWEGAMLLAVCTDGFRLLRVSANSGTVVTFAAFLGAVS